MKKKLVITIILFVMIIAAIYFVSTDICHNTSNNESEEKIKVDSVKNKKILIFNNSIGEGIDISKYQGSINWEKFSENKKFGFVYARATYGCKQKDKYYIEHVEGAKRNNILIGSYHYYLNTQSPEEQFKTFMSIVDKDKQDLIPMVDVEEDSHGRSINWNPQKLKKFLDLIENEFGTKPILYTNKRYYNSYLHKNFSDYPLWIAAYTPNVGKLKNNKQYLIWQYSAKGRIKGINGYVDKNKLHPNATIKDILLEARFIDQKINCAIINKKVKSI